MIFTTHNRNGKRRRSGNAHSAANVAGHEADATGYAGDEGAIGCAQSENGTSRTGRQFLMVINV